MFREREQIRTFYEYLIISYLLLSIAGFLAYSLIPLGDFRTVDSSTKAAEFAGCVLIAIASIVAIVMVSIRIAAMERMLPENAPRTRSPEEIARADATWRRACLFFACGAALEEIYLLHLLGGDFGVSAFLWSALFYIPVFPLAAVGYTLFPDLSFPGEKPPHLFIVFVAFGLNSAGQQAVKFFVDFFGHHLS